MAVSLITTQRKFSSTCLAILLCIHAFAGPASPQAQPGPSPASKAQDVGWPRQITKNGATLVYYQPQIDEWKDYKELSCRVAFSLKAPGDKEVLGVTSLKAGTLVDKDARTAYIRDIQVTSV